MSSFHDIQSCSHQYWNIKHQIDNGKTEAKVTYGELHDDDFDLNVEPCEENDDSENEDDGPDLNEKPPVSVDRCDQTLRNFWMNEVSCLCLLLLRQCFIVFPLL